MPKFLKIENDEIIEHISTSSCPDGYIPSQEFNGFIGEPTSYYNDDWSRKSDTELYREGLKEIPKGLKLLEDGSFIEKTDIEKIQDGEMDMPIGFKFNKDETNLEQMTLQEQFEDSLITIEEYKTQRRRERDAFFYQQDLTTIIERYEEQKKLGLQPNEEQYTKALLYKQYLRDIPQQESFPNEDILVFSDWLATHGETKWQII